VEDLEEMIDSTHLLRYVIRPVLTDLDLWSEPAERLVLGTACQESHCGRWLVQLGDVPGGGLGIYQMEPATHDDIWKNFLNHRKAIASKIMDLRSIPVTVANYAGDMVGNLYYATAMCRIHYLRDPEPLPDDLRGQAEYWKRVYNTHLGKGTVEEYMNNWNRYVPQGVV
jgi:hypothetical protein